MPAIMNRASLDHDRDHFQAAVQQPDGPSASRGLHFGCCGRMRSPPHGFRKPCKGADGKTRREHLNLLPAFKLPAFGPQNTNGKEKPMSQKLLLALAACLPLALAACSGGGGASSSAAPQTPSGGKAERKRPRRRWRRPRPPWPPRIGRKPPTLSDPPNALLRQRGNSINSGGNSGNCRDCRASRRNQSAELQNRAIGHPRRADAHRCIRESRRSESGVDTGVGGSGLCCGAGRLWPTRSLRKPKRPSTKPAALFKRAGSRGRRGRRGGSRACRSTRRFAGSAGLQGNSSRRSRGNSDAAGIATFDFGRERFQTARLGCHSLGNDRSILAYPRLHVDDLHVERRGWEPSTIIRRCSARAGLPRRSARLEHVHRGSAEARRNGVRHCFQRLQRVDVP